MKDLTKSGLSSSNASLSPTQAAHVRLGLLFVNSLSTSPFNKWVLDSLLNPNFLQQSTETLHGV
jgi:hypothetical protein